MNSKVQQIADHFGVKLAYRSARNSHVFDGKSIATCGGSGVHERQFSDHNLLHEIAHYAVAAPEQRDLPEYGLGYAAIAGETYVPNVVDMSRNVVESTIQEFMVQLLCVLWGRAYDISSTLSDEPGEILCSNWDNYLILKINQCICISDRWISYMWQALIRLKDSGMLDNLPLN